MSDNENNKIKSLSISKEMKKSFLEYAMSVIVSRALPNARDGLKPVQRRIIYSMSEQEMTFSKPRKKSAKVVGDVIAKYHPHGDSSVYEAMVRMAQDFSLRYPLVDGQGNFGSIDGDSQAAMRYTEARLSKISSQLLYHIKRDTVDFSGNYDNTESEPVILPTRVPNLLMNGSIGIAVGMATSIPPHNLTELLDAAIRVFSDKDTTIDDVMSIIKGPDFPTGAQILGLSGIDKAYRTGNGSIVVRSEVEIEGDERDGSRIIIKSIPYNVKKSSLIEGIADLVRNQKIKSIREIRDETNHSGIRVILDLKRGHSPEIELNYLYKHSMLQTRFSINMLAIHEKEPITLNILQFLEIYKAHLLDIYRRSIKFSLAKWEARLHIVIGLLKITEGNNIDEVIKIIRSSKNSAEAYERLSKEFGLSAKQAEAVGDMRIIRLNSLDQQKMRDEKNNLDVNIKNGKDLLKHEEKLSLKIVEDLSEIKEQYGDERRTQILSGEYGDISDEDLIAKKDIVIYFSKRGYIKRIPQDEYRAQTRGGVGSAGGVKSNDDHSKVILTTNTHIDLLLFSNLGKVYRMRATKIPEASKQAKGLPIVNIITSMEKGEEINVILPIDNYDENNYLTFVTNNGLVKRTSSTEFKRINLSGKIAIKLKEGDYLSNVLESKDDQDLFISASNGKVIRFGVKNVKVSGRVASGSTGIALVDDSIVVSSSIFNSQEYILSFASNGYGKLSDSTEYSKTNKAGRGYKTINLIDDSTLVGMSAVSGDEDILIMTNKGTTIRLSLKHVSKFSKNTKGVKLIRLRNNESIASYSIVSGEDIESENEDMKNNGEIISIDEN